jgi:hypothetical protein
MGYKGRRVKELVGSEGLVIICEICGLVVLRYIELGIKPSIHGYMQSERRSTIGAQVE